MARILQRVLSGMCRVGPFFGLKASPPRWLSRYERDCLHWYVDETNAMATAFAARFPNITYVSVDITDLNSVASVNQMANAFGWQLQETAKEVIGVKQKTS